jgi:hypothetical protein
MPRNVQTLQEEWLTLCRRYFPHWHQAHRWTLRNGTRGSYRMSSGKRTLTTEYGFCNTTTHRIYVSIPRTNPQERLLTLLHEGCHALTTGGHGVVWQRRMLTLADRVEQLGEVETAQALRKEVAGYAQALRAVPLVYSLVEDWVIDNPALTMPQVMEGIAQQLASMPQEVRHDFPRIEAVYQKAQRAAQRMAYYEAQMRKRYGHLMPLTPEPTP